MGLGPSEQQQAYLAKEVSVLVVAMFGMGIGDFRMGSVIWYGDQLEWGSVTLECESMTFEWAWTVLRTMSCVHLCSSL